MLRTFAFSLTLVISASALAGTACPQHFAAGQAPVISNPKFQARTQEICFQAFAVLHSGMSRTPLYAAEHLTRANLKKAKALSRRDSFHAEDALPERDRAELDDYARSGYDRGHLAPNANFANRKAQAESFSLANMVPQVHANNAGVWADIEGVAREMASREGELYVITGPAFIGARIQKIGNRVLVPTHLWKVLYSPTHKRAGAYLITNEDTQEYKTLTVAQLEKMIGMSLLPGLPPSVRDAGMALPDPAAPPGRRPTSQQKSETAQEKSEAAQKKEDVPEKEDDVMLKAFFRLVVQVIQDLISQALKN